MCPAVQCFAILYIASNAEFSARWVISRSQFDAGGWLWETRQHQPLICSSAYMQQATNPARLMHEKSAHIFRGAHFHADSRGWTLSCLLSSIRAQCIKRPQAQGVAQPTLWRKQHLFFSLQPLRVFLWRKFHFLIYMSILRLDIKQWKFRIKSTCC